MVNIKLLTAMPSAIVPTAASVNPGLFARIRQPNRMSGRMLIVPASAGRYTLERTEGGSMASSWQRATRRSTRHATLSTVLSQVVDTPKPGHYLVRTGNRQVHQPPLTLANE